MIFDDVRNDAYFMALQPIISPDSIVLDLGAGLGLHGLMAARLGARKVYLVEPTDVIEVARKIVLANGLEDRVECIKGRIEDIKLPEKVDVIISVFTGHFLLEEHLLPSLFYARDTHLKPGGKLIPDAAIMETVPVFVPKLTERFLNVWSEPQYDLSFSAVRPYASNRPRLYKSADLEDISYIGEPQKLAEYDFYATTQASCHQELQFKATSQFKCNGLLGWFRIKLDEAWLSTGPFDAQTHWSSICFPFDPPITIEKEEIIDVLISRKEHGYWAWRLVAASDKQLRSSFLA